MSDAPLLEVRDVVRTFGGLHAVDHASFTVAAGSITALIGPNGAGKTTLFHIIAGFLSAEGGTVTFAGRPILGEPAHAIASMGVVRTFQQTRTLTAMTVLDNMLLAGSRQPGERFGGSLARPRAARRRERELTAQALELLAQFELRSKADEYAGTLSGGQRKLLELARVLMAEPRLVLLDEPMAGINPALGIRLMEHIERLRRDGDMTFLFVEHDMDVVMNHADHVVVMASGRVIAADVPQVVRDDPGVVDAYLGTHHGGTSGNG